MDAKCVSNTWSSLCIWCRAKLSYLRQNTELSVFCQGNIKSEYFMAFNLITVFIDIFYFVYSFLWGANDTKKGKCKDLMYKIWWDWRYVYTHEMNPTIKVINIFISSRSFLLFQKMNILELYIYLPWAFKHLKSCF